MGIHTIKHFGRAHMVVHDATDITSFGGVGFVAQVNLGAWIFGRFAD
jgi:hypothetical protein